jgi:hypothetical protein
MSEESFECHFIDSITEAQDRRPQSESRRYGRELKTHRSRHDEQANISIWDQLPRRIQESVPFAIEIIFRERI